MLFSVDSNLLVFSTLGIGALNLAVPWLAKNQLRTFLVITISLLFLLNILIVTWLHLAGILQFNLTIFTLDQYIFALHLEPLGLIFLGLISILWVLALLYSLPYLRVNNIENSSQFIFFLNLCILIGVLLALAANLLTMFVFYEFLSLATIPLLSHLKTPGMEKNISSYFKILMLTSIGFLLPAISVVYHQTGAGNFILGGFLADYFSQGLLKILLLLFIFGISKTALVPFHSWLTAAMVAPYPVSAMLHAVIVVKAGLFCTFKILLYVFGLEYLEQIFGTSNWLIYLPICTIIYSSIRACLQKNIKMILAYSTINHLSLALLSAFMLTPKSMFAAILHLLAHSLGKICLFYGLGCLYSLNKVVVIDDLTSLNASAPKISVIILLSMLALIGIPPFGGFISKFYILSASVEQNQPVVILTIIFSSMLSALYFGNIALKLYQPRTRLAGVITTESNLPFLMIFSCLLCLGLNLLFVFVLPILSKLTWYIL